MGNIFYWDFEAEIILWMQHFAEGTFLQTVLIALNNFFSFCGEEIFGVLILGIFYWGIDKKKGLLICNALLLGENINILIKNIFCRLRPWQSVEEIELIRDVDGYSFPSGHSTDGGSVYGTLWGLHKDSKFLKAVAIVLPLCIACSRMYLGAHWFSDVVVGLALGWGIALFNIKVVAKCKNMNRFFLGEIIIASAGWFYCTTSDYFMAYGLLCGAFVGKLIEEKWVHFETTKNIPIVIIRTVIGAGLFVGLNEVIKALFGANLVDGTTPGNIFRAARYCFIGVVLVGIYPLAFRPAEKLFAKISKKKA